LNCPVSHGVNTPVPPPPKGIGLTVTIVICTRKRPAMLRECLEAVSALEPLPNEVLVVDNSEGCKETESIARSFSARYTVEKVAGLSRARNRGMVESGTDIVAFLDDDAMPDRNWLKFLLAPFTFPQVAVVTGQTVFRDASVDEVSKEQPRTLTNRNPLWFEIATFGGLGGGRGGGSNMALRKAACGDGAIFDLRLGRGSPIRIAEESVAFALLLARGYEAVHVPAATVAHPRTFQDIELQATSSVAYWLLLFFEFPGHRMDLLRFLLRRLRRKPLTWPRNPQAPGMIITSGWKVHLRAGLHGSLLFLRCRRPSNS